MTEYEKRYPTVWDFIKQHKLKAYKFAADAGFSSNRLYALFPRSGQPSLDSVNISTIMGLQKKCEQYDPDICVWEEWFLPAYREKLNIK